MTSGIYCFKHRSKPFMYIGSSKDIENRYYQHIREMSTETHINLSLQEDYLKGELDFEVLAKDIDENLLLNFEQKYCIIFLEKGYALYNRNLPKASNYDKYDKCMLVSKNIFEKDFNNLEIKTKNEEIMLKYENEVLEKENEVLKKENEILKMEKGMIIISDVLKEKRNSEEYDNSNNTIVNIF